MKRTFLAVLVVALVAGALWRVGVSQEVRRERGDASTGSAVPPAARAEDDRAIREAIDAFTKAFREGNAKAIVGLFSEDGEAVDAEGNTIHGRSALEEHYAGRIAEAPGDKLDITVQAISFLAPGVAQVSGSTQVTPSDGTAPFGSGYVAILTKREARWLLASVREVPEKDLTPHEHLKELEWLVGDWVQESDEAVVSTSVAWSDNGNFLLRSFDVRIKGKPALTGTQRIGWDPLTKQLKSWVFDSSGGYGDALWMRQGNQWVVKATGVRPDGRVATATQVLTYVTKDSLRWKSIDRTLGSDISQDIDEIGMVRKPPRPEAK
jgi:uncharacterized protein (TIGR02246 family)